MTASIADDGSPDCTLCGLDVGTTPISVEDVEGVYCCQGCLTIQRALGDLEEIEPDDIRDAPDREKSPVPPDAATAFLAVDGMHCTTCESFLETRGATISGIYTVEASYATDTARVTYDSAQLDEDKVAACLSGYGYTARQRRHVDLDEHDETVIRFLLGGGLFGMMVMVWYALFLYPTYFGLDPLVDLGGFSGFYIVANIWLFTSFVLFYTGWPILRGAYVSLRAGAPNMDLLVALAATSAYAYSTVAMVLGRTDLYFDVSVAIILVVTAGTYYEKRLKQRAISGLTTSQSAATTSVRSPDGTTRSRNDVEVGEELLVRPGERLPFDGIITDGRAAIDVSLMTGEPLPQSYGPGDAVPGGAVVTDEPIVIEVTDVDSSTRERLLAQLWSIQSATPGVQRLADRLATIVVPLVVVLALVVGSLTVLSGGTLAAGVLLGLTVLIVTCPCALGLATPLAIASGVRSGLERGIVIASAAVFEAAPSIDIVVFDKTGTLTDGKLAVQAIHGEDPDTVLERAAAIERHSTHPIATAIVAANSSIPAAISTDGGVVSPTDIESGDRGLVGRVGTDQVVVGHPSLLAAEGLSVPDHLVERTEIARSAGHIPVVVGWDGRAHGVIVVGDTPRPDWEATVAQLATAHEVVILTGDDGESAERFRTNEAVSQVFSGVPPAAKTKTIQRLQQRGTVAMVGDGSNDAPALAAADLGIAFASGTALASDAADAIVLSDELPAVPALFDLVHNVNSRIRQNLGWAFVYNGIAIPLAIVGLLNPFLAALAMATSSLLVVANSARSLWRS